MYCSRNWKAGSIRPPGLPYSTSKKDLGMERARVLLRCCRAAMTEAARLIVVETVVPAGNEPAYAKLLDLLMLVYAGGRERTEAEYRELLRSAGFSPMRLVSTASAVSLIEAKPI
jgi:hypothetical protein